MISKIDRKATRQRRHLRVRTKISGTAECPRLCVFRSNTNLYAQDEYGYDGKRYTSYDAFLKSIESFRDLLKTNMGSYVYGYVDNPEPENTIKYPETSIAFPVNIGCKRGGADWQIIKRMIEMTFENMNVVIEYWDFDTPENENR